MADIPEHLLKRSKAALAKASGSEVPADSTESTGANAGSGVVAATAAADLTPSKQFPNLDSKPKPPAPEPNYVRASKARSRVPVWALPVIPATLIWAWGFAATMQEPELEDAAYIQSAALYSSSGCAGCHGGTGGGGTGYKLNEGEVLQTFPDPIDQMVHVARGSADIAGQEYGAAREDGIRVSGARKKGAMPGQLEQMSQVELELVVFHERASLSGEDTSTPEYEEWLDHLRENIDDDTPIDLELLLACANPEVTPGATGAGSPDDRPCPGPAATETGEEEPS